MSGQGNTHQEQPSATPAMSPTADSEAKNLVKSVGTEYIKSAAKEGGKETMQYETANGQQQLDNAKAQAEGLWAKYCGCFSGN